MQKTYIKDLSNHVGEEVSLKGWIFNKRSSGKIKFIILRDGTGLLQCVYFKGNISEEVFNLADRLGQESSIEVKGKVKGEPRAVGGYELDASDLKVIGEAHDYPITPKEHGVEFLMDNRHLWLRSSKQIAIMRIRHRIVKAIRDFFDDRGFTLMDPPILTPAACEGTSTLFETEYFDLGKAYLTQSGQLYAEAGAMALGKVYTFGPTFRAEKSKTRRHLTEFWMVEPEVAFADLNDDMDLAEEFLECIVQTILKEKQEELIALERDTTKLANVKRPLPRISYDEAVEILKRNGIDFQWGNDLGGTDETVISNQFDKPVMVHRYPAEVKAFYMKRDPNNDKLALAVDVLAPEGYGEIIGGSQREDNLEVLQARIKEQNLPQQAFEWYLDLRRYGSVPHAGFGLGLERTVGWICGLEHLRETIPFARMIYRNTP
ncbi:MAG: asparagine--tRNA ligase [Ignavibacteria bacterium RIFOXYB2_FULL_35_12]|nr:MAG: asparagine--tRNA ligase [Ignavibacteria bacterium GWA2_36_19]OGU53272.1 MAG: asparagine--tRNA ligase [Ignavibacteria bacterium GWC2_35_8]OGU56423.1 MAG: asparagine--tRNA ligase [Ignavibacteria bacterium GWF2_35_20]OGU90839.1 MAG: asparagine--tRNA ligase [Ignavibacteria bacterium RIFOXYA12_FULL_35_25]OGU91514.1 MAG: asparagine--tRNA ligase [Ignavibacteria bacterium RIFOXYC12_FULL_35_11]OGU94497.1 MAG: asparagine--tRNA ligase [Ignavibacteria bacterium RIFOXYB12_FULL_35_14]OGU99685.1 MAG